MEEAPWKIAPLWLLAAACLFPGVTPPAALFAGLIFSVVIGRTDSKRAAKIQKYLLQGSVVGLGFGIQLSAVLQAGSTGLFITAGWWSLFVSFYR